MIIMQFKFEIEFPYTQTKHSTDVIMSVWFIFNIIFFLKIKYNIFLVQFISIIAIIF